MLNDRQLLDRYVSEVSEEAFGELVRRHMALVYSAALRQVRDPQRAQDVTQLVFINLARQARSISADTVLAGWLHRDTRFTALDLLRAEARRTQREQQAAAMHALDSEPSPAWEQIRPLLDEALDALSPTDRDALLLRYFEERDFAAVGAALGASAEAARKRVDRALDRLREFLVKRGIDTTVAALGTTLSAHAIEAVPAGFAVSLVAGSAAAVTTAAAPAAVSWFSNLLLMTKTKLAVGTALVAATLATPLLIQEQALTKARAEQAALLARVRELPAPNPPMARIANPTDDARRDREELERLRRETAAMRARNSELNAQAEQLAAANPARKVTGVPIGETFRPDECRDVGQATPAALFQTHTWAMLSGDTNRMAQLMAFAPETDMLRVQRKFEAIHKDATSNREPDPMEAQVSGLRLVEEQPAEGNDRWIVGEIVLKNGEVRGRNRTRIRFTDTGWKIVIGIDGGPVSERLDEQP